MFNPLEERLEEFSPLHIDSTLELIRGEFSEGHNQLAQGLLERLQFPLTLGGIKESLKVGIHYIERFLASRMLKGRRGVSEKSKDIAKKLVKSYATHAFCIDIDEANELGLRAEMLNSEEIEATWEIRSLLQKRDEIQRMEQRKQMKEMLEKLPPELLEDLSDNDTHSKSNGTGHPESSTSNFFAQMRVLRGSRRKTAGQSNASRALAAGLLIQNGELSYSQIRALPTVEDDDDVSEVIEYLRSEFDTEATEEKESSWPVLTWEKVIRLNQA